jgi:hypothetical protein
MKKIKPITINDENSIVDEKNYIMMVVPYSRFGGENEEEHYSGNGAEVKEKLKEIFAIKEWLEDVEQGTWEDFCEYIYDCNGDGEAFIEIFEI